MNTQPDLFPETLLVTRDGGRLFTTSLKVAEHFHKRHTHVLRAVENLLSDLGVSPDPGASTEPNFGLSDAPDCSSILRRDESKVGFIEMFNVLNFEQATYLDRTGRTLPMYKLNEEAFALVAMGFTGKEALAWKVRFLAAFRDLERQLHVLKEREAQALYRLRPRWHPILENPRMRRKELIALTGHQSEGSITACRRRMRQVGLLEG